MKGAAMTRRQRSAALPCRVSTHAGYKADKYPVRFVLGDTPHEVVEVEDRWYDPACACFRVFADNAVRYLLRRDTASGDWTAQPL